MQDSLGLGPLRLESQRRHAVGFKLTTISKAASAWSVTVDAGGIGCNSSNSNSKATATATPSELTAKLTSADAARHSHPLWCPRLPPRLVCRVP
jgi:hypothetical protein